MNNLLIENAATIDALKRKFETAIHLYYELENTPIEFYIITTHIAKARQMVARLTGSKKAPAIEVSFNSDYFT